MYKAKTVYSSVGTVNVIKTMKKHKALIGGEGNGGVIWPKVHYERDSLAGVSLILSYISQKNISLSEAVSDIPRYFFLKEKVELKKQISLDKLISTLKKTEKKAKINTTDGLKLDFPDYWIHIRKSNTEPIMRIYTESFTQREATAVFQKYKKLINSLV